MGTEEERDEKIKISGSKGRAAFKERITEHLNWLDTYEPNSNARIGLENIAKKVPQATVEDGKETPTADATAQAADKDSEKPPVDDQQKSKKKAKKAKKADSAE